MACCACSVMLIVFLAIALRKVYQLLKRYFEVPPVPKLPETWWGPRSEADEDKEIREFKVHASVEVITDLAHRLANARPFVKPLEGIQHQYGINTNLLQEILDFWRTNYDWRSREAYLNKFPQYTVSIQGLKIHYLHVKPEDPGNVKVLPLLLLHGWPGSVREFYEIIPLLTTPRPGRKFVFEVIVPSLPGYGFSEAAVRPGLGIGAMAVLLKNLMLRLGHEKFYIQGGDWGAAISSHMGALFPDHVLGVHTNMGFVNSLKSNFKTFLYSLWPSKFVEKRFEERMFPWWEKFGERILETGYMHIQATKPDTIGVALNDSPIGLAAYIIEKFITWTDPKMKNQLDGGLQTKFNYTNLLDNVMIYWVSNSITTSMRLYAEAFTKEEKAFGLDGIPVTVPTAVARFTNEMVYLPRSILEEKFKNIVYESDHEGGHFPALEIPEVLAEDVFAGIEKMELYHIYYVPPI